MDTSTPCSTEMSWVRSVRIQYTLQAKVGERELGMRPIAIYVVSVYVRPKYVY